MSATPPWGRTLLVVEDNEVTREGLAAILRREGYAAVLAGDGREALDYLRSNPPPDLILLDMLLPVLDGWRFLERLQRGAVPAAIPVLITTGTILTREWAADHSCAGFIPKPIDTDALLAEIRRCLGG